MDEIYKINDHITKRVLNEYGGSEKKWTVYLDDTNKYLLKFPDPIRELGRNISYINNSFSEYIGCQTYNSLGIPVQETKLGIFETENGKQKIACLCKDIRKKNERLIEFDKLALELFDEPIQITFKSIEDLISRIPGIDICKALTRYYDMFIVDAFLGNTDRHNGNWGILLNEDSRKIQLAPVYDCGSCLSPLLSDEELTSKRILNDSANIKSVITENNTRIHYRDYIESHENKNVDNALKRIIPKINLEKIKEIISNIPYISDTRKVFYISLLENRYHQILLPALKEVLSQKDKKTYKLWSSVIMNEIWKKEMILFTMLQNGSTAKILYHNKPIDIIKNNDNVFLYNEEELIGIITTAKSNKNISNFVDIMTRFDIDIVTLYNYPTERSEDIPKELNERSECVPKEPTEALTKDNSLNKYIQTKTEEVQILEEMDSSELLEDNENDYELE